MRMSPSHVTAELLISSKTKLGRTVPLYAKKIVEGTATGAECKRVFPELYKMLQQMRSTQRAQLFENRRLAVWYILYSEKQDPKHLECAMLTGNMDEEHRQKQAEALAEI